MGGTMAGMFLFNSFSNSSGLNSGSDAGMGEESIGGTIAGIIMGFILIVFGLYIAYMLFNLIFKRR
jgi:hypothetical protein